MADVFLNGKKLGHTENMHRTWVYQVKELVKEGENLLELHIASPVKFIETYKPEKGSFQMRDFSAVWSSAALILQDWANP